MRALFMFVGVACVSVCGALSSSKMSLHAASSSSNVVNFVQQAKPRVIKLLDMFGSFPTQLKKINPGMIIVGRIYLPDQPMSGDPTTQAKHWWNGVAKTILSSESVDYWEGYNEPDSSYRGLTWLAQFEVARIGILAQHGLKASIGNFGTGNPDVNNATVMNAFNPAIDAALANGGILGLHEYNSPIFSNCFDKSTGEGWMMGRYRKYYRNYLLPHNRKIPLIVSESGIDNSGCPSPNLGGWRNYCDWWRQNLHATDCNAEYVKQISWYDSIIREDDYVLGATLFCQECSAGWAPYDTTEVLPDLISYMNSVQLTFPL